MKLPRHHNHEYTGQIPKGAGDRYYAQDLARDFWMLKDSAGRTILDTIGVPIITTGGKVTRLTATTIDVEKCVAYVEFDVEVIDTFTGFPPTKRTQTVIARAESGFDGSDDSIASETVDITTLPGYVAGAQTYKLLLKYVDKDGDSRARAFAAGSYNYEKIPSYAFSLTTGSPGNDAAVVAIITTDGSGQIAAPGDIDQENAAVTKVTNVDQTLPPVGSIISIHKNVISGFTPSPKVWAYCGATPPVAGWVAAGGRIAGDALPTDRFTAGTVPALDDDRFLMGGDGTADGAADNGGSNKGHFHGFSPDTTTHSLTADSAGDHNHELRRFTGGSGTTYRVNAGAIVTGDTPTHQETTNGGGVGGPYPSTTNDGAHGHNISGTISIGGDVGNLSGHDGDAAGSNRPRYFGVYYYMRIR